MSSKQAKITTVFNQKGGSGKTTLTMQLGGTIQMRGYNTLIIDMDPQGTASRHSASAPDDKAFPAQVISLAAHGGKMHREVARHAGAYDVILIDCPPAADSPAPQSAMLVSDLALIPVIPAPGDMWATETAKLLVENARIHNENLVARIVPNLVRHTALAKELLAVMAKDEDCPVTKTLLELRNAYCECLLRGGTVHDVPLRQSKAAIAEVEALTTEVLGLLNLPAYKKGAKK